MEIQKRALNQTNFNRNKIFIQIVTYKTYQTDVDE